MYPRRQFPLTKGFYGDGDAVIDGEPRGDNGNGSFLAVDVGEGEGAGFVFKRAARKLRGEGCLIGEDLGVAVAADERRGKICA